MKKSVKMLVSSAIIGAMAFGMCACTQSTPTQAPTAAPTDGTTRKDEVLDYVKTHQFEVLIVLGAGDLDNQVPQITKILNSK